MTLSVFIYFSVLVYGLLGVSAGVYFLLTGWLRYLRLEKASHAFSGELLQALAARQPPETLQTTLTSLWSGLLPGGWLAFMRYDATALQMIIQHEWRGHDVEPWPFSTPPALPGWPPIAWGKWTSQNACRLTGHFSDNLRFGRWPAAGGGRWDTSALAVPIYLDDNLYGLLALDLPIAGYPTAELLEVLAQQSATALSASLSNHLGGLNALHLSESVFFELAPVPMLTFDATQHVTQLNAQARALSGVTQEELKNRQHCGIFCREQHRDGICPMQKTLASGTSEWLRMELFGTIYEALTVPLHHDGKLIGGMVALIDLTELANSQRHFRETSELMSTILEILPCMVLVKESGVDGRCVIGNRYLHEFLGREAGDLPGKTDREIFGDEVAERFALQDEQAMQQGMLELSQKYHGLNGQTAYLHTFKVRVPRGESQDLLLTISFDVTEITLARQELERHQRELQQANDALRQYLRQSQTLRDCTEHLVTDLYSDGAMQMLVTRIGEMLEADLCAIVEYVGEGSAPVAVWQGARFSIAAFAPITGGHPLARSEIYSTGRLTAVRGESTGNIELDRELEEFFAMSGAGSVLCIRIQFNGKVWGHFGCFCQVRRPVGEAKEHGIREAGRVVELILIRQALMEQLFRKEQQLSLALDAAQGSVQAKSMFLATMSHEIRTPLNAVIGFSELLKNPTVSLQERQEYTTGIAHAGNALLQLINDILDLSKIEAGQFELPDGRCSLPHLLAEIHSIFGRKAHDKGVDFRVLYDPRLPLLRLNEQRMRQVLLNLVGNAMKFTASGYIICRVDFNGVGAEPERGKLCIEVEDSGMGVEEQSRENIFEPFTQQKATARGSRVFEGTGLGLPIAKRMIEKMGGTLTLTSEFGVGSIFTITIPEVETIALERTVAQVSPTEEESAPASHPGLRVLLVDDIQVNLRVLSGYLQRFQVTSHGVCSGADALDYLRTHERPDLVMTDMWMPAMNGAELAEQIRALPGMDDLPIVAVTADIEVGDNFDLKCFNAVLHKPLSPGKVRQVLRLVTKKLDETVPPGPPS